MLPLINYFSISLSTKRDLIIVLHCALLVDIEHLFMFASHVGLFFFDIFFFLILPTKKFNTTDILHIYCMYTCVLLIKKCNFHFHIHLYSHTGRNQLLVPLG